MVCVSIFSSKIGKVTIFAARSSLMSVISSNISLINTKKEKGNDTIRAFIKFTSTSSDTLLS